MTAREWGRAILFAGVALGGGLAIATPGLTQPGERAQGRAVFEAKHCARCHRSPGRDGAGPPLETLQRPQGTFELAGRLWNHAPGMFGVLLGQGLEWPAISETEMADLMTFLGADATRDRVPNAARGQDVLVRKGCLKCHALRGEGARIGPDLGPRRAAYGSASTWAATMWTHTPRMAMRAREMGVLYPRFSDEEMGHLVAFLRSVSR